MKTRDKVELFLGVDVSHNNVKKRISIHQQHYIKACFRKFGMADCKGVDTPKVSCRLSVKDHLEKVDPALRSPLWIYPRIRRS